MSRPFSLVLVLLFVGCSANVEPPELLLETPKAFATAEPTEASPVADAWWEEFGSAELDAVVEATLANNPNLAAAAANFESALAQARIDAAALKPQVSLGTDASRRQQNFIGFPIPGAEEGQVLSTTATFSNLSLNASWEADLWGRLRAQKQAGLASALAAEADLAAARLSLAGQAAKAWLALVEAEQQVLLAEQTLDSRQSTEDRIDARYRRGLTQPLDLRLTKAQTASVEAQLAQRRQTLDAARRQLEALTGVYPNGEIEAGVELPSLPPRPAAGVPADVVARRPDLRAAESRALAASARVRAAQRALYPTLSLSGSTGTAAGSDLEDLLNGDFSVWSLAASLLQPIFQGGRLRANVSLAEAGLESSEATWLQTTLQAFVEVETALASEGFIASQVDALAESSSQNEAAQRLALGRYNRGLADFLTVLDSQRSTFQSQSQLLTAKRQQLAARVDLILALGGAPTAEPNTESSEADSSTTPSSAH
ncbi:MAG: efflux transporter outer membrane subunit [Acidobacteriota bacterium]